MIIGIDVGTSQSGGHFNKGTDGNGNAIFHEVLNESARKGIKREDNEKYFPSYVQYDDDGKIVVVGEKAKILAYNFPNNTVYDSKRLIGRRFDDKEVQNYKRILEEKGHYGLCEENGEVRIKIGEKRISPEEVASEIIIEIVKNAFKQESTLEIDRMVISVPAYFGLVQRTRTKMAAIIAIKELKKKYPGRINIEIEKKSPEGIKDKNPEEIDDIKLISEPTAAFITYKARGGLEGITGEEYVLVFDLGAGTLDITIGTCKVITDPLGNEDVLLDIKTIHGNTALGGRDMDEKIMEWVKGELKKAIDPSMMHEIGKQVELAKIRLSKRESTPIPIKFSDLNTGITLNRTKTEHKMGLEEIINPIVEQCKKEIRTAMEKAKVKKGDIKRIVMVGGPTYMPVIRKAVEEEVGTKIKEIPGWNPMTCVSEGAARSGIIIEPPPFDYYIAASVFDEIVPLMKMVSVKDRLPVSIKQTVGLPSFAVNDIDSVKLCIVEHREESDNIIKNIIVQELTLHMPARSSHEGDKFCSAVLGKIEYSGILVKNWLFSLGYEEIEINGKITEEHLMENPVFFQPRTGKRYIWTDLPFKPGKEFDFTEKAEFEKNWKVLARKFLENREKDIDIQLEQHFPELIEAITTAKRCSRNDAKLFIYIKIIEDLENFDRLRENALKVIEKAEKKGDNHAREWKKQWTEANTPTFANVAILRNVIEAI